MNNTTPQAGSQDAWARDLEGTLVSARATIWPYDKKYWDWQTLVSNHYAGPLYNLLGFYAREVAIITGLVLSVLTGWGCDRFFMAGYPPWLRFAVDAAVALAGFTVLWKLVLGPAAESPGEWGRTYARPSDKGNGYEYWDDENSRVVPMPQWAVELVAKIVATDAGISFPVVYCSGYCILYAEKFYENSASGQRSSIIGAWRPDKSRILQPIGL